MKAFKPTVNLGLMAAVAVLLGWSATAYNAQAAHSDYSCASCHVPHTANSDVDGKSVPLWNPDHKTTTLTGNYTSPTMDATTGAPDGSSKLCLSCHDGSYGHVEDAHAFSSPARSSGEMGTLETSHPISFSYAEAFATDGELEDPANLASDVLDANGKMQCTSCHDVHATAAPAVPSGNVDDPATPDDESMQNYYLRWTYQTAGYAPGSTSAFCRKCHVAK